MVIKYYASGQKNGGQENVAGRKMADRKMAEREMSNRNIDGRAELKKLGARRCFGQLFACFCAAFAKSPALMIVILAGSMCLRMAAWICSGVNASTFFSISASQARVRLR